jgi:hypothetical protein
MENNLEFDLTGSSPLVLSEPGQNFTQDSPASKQLELTGDNITCSLKKNPNGLIIVSGQNSYVSIDNPVDCTVRCMASCTIRFNVKASILTPEESKQTPKPEKEIIPENESKLPVTKNQNQDAETIIDEYEDASGGNNSSGCLGDLADEDSTDNWKDKLKTEEEKCCVCLEYIYCDPENKPFWT